MTLFLQLLYIFTGSLKDKIEDEEAQTVKDALAKHGTLLALKFYIAGYTDTVGNAAYNRDLSKRRARSIAAWFRAQGLKIPVYYEGFGESVLAKKTPDETDEPANRRALYILTSQAPSGAPFPSAKWKRL